MAEPMSLVTVVYLALPTLAIVVSSLLASYIYRYHWDQRGSTSFLLILVTGTIWVALLFGHVLLSDSALLVPIATVELVAALTSFAVFTLFVSRYTDSGYHRSWVYQGAFVAVVGGFAALAATNRWHGLVYRDYRIATEPFTYVAFDHGLGWVLATTLVSVMAGYSAYVLVEDMLSTTGRAGMQLVMLVAAILSVSLAEVLGQAGLFPADGFHHAAYGTLPWVVLMTFALFRFRLFDMQPVARNVVVETLQDPVIVLDSDHRIADANAQAERVWPTIESGIGESFADICPFVAETLELPTTEPQTSRITLPGDDRYRHYSMRVSAVGDEDESGAIGYAILLRDVTELEESRQRLERQNEQLDRVASTVSHDLRNPLNVAAGYLELVHKEITAQGEDELVAYLENIDDAHQRMDDIIDDVLTLARDGQSAHEPVAVDLSEVAQEAWQTVETTGATLVVKRDGTLWTDRSRLRTIFENLFGNAIEHGLGTATDGGTPSVTITVGAFADGDGETTDTGFYVADDGSGISEDARDQLFEYGFTTSEGGTGLGLAIVQTMAESQGWTVSHDDERDEGTRFVFSNVYLSPSSADLAGGSDGDEN